MRVARSLVRLGGLSALLGIAACSADSTVSPKATVGGSTAELSLLAAPVEVKVLQRKQALATAQSASVTVGFLGGVLQLPGAGLRIVIPAGAVNRTTTITATAVAGSAVAYEFQPHGIQFNVPLVAIQDLSGTKTTGLDPLKFFAGYFASSSDLDVSKLTATVSEILGLGVNIGAQIAVFNIRHFSGYIIATGRCSDAEDGGSSSASQ
jgi:hypothetical protein